MATQPDQAWPRFRNRCRRERRMRQSRAMSDLAVRSPHQLPLVCGHGTSALAPAGRLLQEPSVSRLDSRAVRRSSHLWPRKPKAMRGHGPKRPNPSTGAVELALPRHTCSPVLSYGVCTLMWADQPWATFADAGTRQSLPRLCANLLTRTKSPTQSQDPVPASAPIDHTCSSHEYRCHSPSVSSKGPPSTPSKAQALRLRCRLDM